MTNKRSRLIWLLLAALTVHPSLKAQHTEVALSPKPSLLQQEILDLNSSIQLNGNVVILNDNQVDGSLDLSEDLDYLSTTTLLPLINNSDILNQPKNFTQFSTSKDLDISTSNFTKLGNANISCKLLDVVTINGLTVKNVKCVTLQDRYSVTAATTGIKFNYINCYYLFFDASTNNLITSTSYIKRESNYLVSEFKLADNRNTLLVKNVIENSNTLEISPNPSDNVIHIKFSLNGDAATTIQIKDIQGRIVKQVISNSNYVKGEHQITENISSLPTGQYLINLVTNDVTISKKLIIKH